MLHVKNISFAYGDSIILKDISFSVLKGQNIAVIGESGSGKSTLLNLIYGQFDLKSGDISWNENRILGPAFNLVVGYDFMKQVTQEFDLMPFTTVAENIGEFLSNFYPEEKAQRTKELIEVVELEAFTNTKVKTLSGGQKQRVALARALAKEPEILLLDEPFSHIDNFKKQSLRRSVFSYLKSRDITCIVATHDKDDVMGFADEMLVLHNRTIIKHGTPEALFKNPENALIASFFSEYSIVKGAIYYAHEIKLVTSSEHNAIVNQCYFNGTNWLVEATLDETGSKVFFYSDYSLKLSKSVAIDLPS